VPACTVSQSASVGWKCCQAIVRQSIQQIVQQAVGANVLLAVDENIEFHPWSLLPCIGNFCRRIRRCAYRSRSSISGNTFLYRETLSIITALVKHSVSPMVTITMHRQLLTVHPMVYLPFTQLDIWQHFPILRNIQHHYSYG
jgi:hypothetical protein